jgi:hypothetical protein
MCGITKVFTPAAIESIGVANAIVVQALQASRNLAHNSNVALFFTTAGEVEGRSILLGDHINIRPESMVYRNASLLDGGQTISLLVQARQTF